MNLGIEIRFAVLISLLMLLWLMLEYLVGLHDQYIQYHPAVTLFALIIPVGCSYLAVKEKTIQLGGAITFKQAFITGFFIAVFAAVLTVPTQFMFHNLVNPDFFQIMIDYACARAASLHMNVPKAKEEATMYFNLPSYIVQCFFSTLFFGVIISLVMAWRMRTVK